MAQRPNPFPRPHGLYLVAAWACLSVRQVGAIRGVDSCYADYKMSCQNHKAPIEDLGFDLVELQRICNYIEEDVLKREYVVIRNPELHRPYLNAVKASDEICPRMQKAYSHCSFCLSNAGLYDSCNSYNENGRCTEGQLTREEVVENKDTYSFINSVEDINAICSDLEYARLQWLAPKTVDLCQKQELILHLCPGQCEDSAPCFSPDELSCQNNLVSENVTDPSDYDARCKEMMNHFLGKLDNVEVFNTSNHRQFFAAEDTNCPFFKSAHSHCFWCQNDAALCFDESNPPSCDIPQAATTTTNVREANRVCEDILLQNILYLYSNKQLSDLSFMARNMFILEGTSLCQEARQVFHKCIWCDPKAPPFDWTTFDMICTIAANVAVPEEFKSNILEFANTTNQALTEDECNDLNFPLFDDGVFPVTTDIAYQWLALYSVCRDTFCPPPPEQPKDYLGTTTDAQRKALIWASRCSAFLSLFGASYILYDILKKPKTRSTVYHQILIGMAIFDMVTAIAWVFATAPIDQKEPVEGAIGNEATCKAQAFFIQLGFTAVFYNVSLAAYYVLVIAYSWREFQLKKISPYLHAVPLTVGMGLAFGGIPIYGLLEYGCHIKPSGHGDSIWQVLVFVVLPLGLSIVAITVSMLAVYWSVRKQTLIARKWNLGSNQADNMEKAVFWQCFFYVLAFFITWPIMFAVYLFSVDEYGPLALTMTVAFVAPLQGFSNFVVYLRTKLKNKKPKQKNQSKAGLVSRILSKLMAMLRLKAKHTSPDDPNDETGHDVYSDTELDPAAALADHRDRISELIASQCSGDHHQQQQAVDGLVMAPIMGGSSLDSLSLSSLSIVANSAISGVASRPYQMDSIREEEGKVEESVEVVPPDEEVAESSLAEFQSCRSLGSQSANRKVD